MKLLHLLQASIAVVGVVALVATAPGCGDERRGKTVVVEREDHGRNRHRDRDVVIEKDSHPRRTDVNVHGNRDGDRHDH
jgi:hypothetical protein